MPHNSVTIWLDKLRSGDPEAAQPLWEAYFRRLVGLARTNLEGRVRLKGDEEDVALSAFRSFCRGMERGRYPNLADRDELWNLLVTITLHKVLHLVRDESRQKRGGGRRLGLDGADDDGDLLRQLVAAEPTPEDAALLTEEAELLLAQLPSRELVELALLKMEGYTNAEISQRWAKTERTVERKLQIIRKIWEREGEV